MTDTCKSRGRHHITQLQGVLDKAVAAHDVPFAVGMVGTSSGITFQGSAGEAASGRAADLDTVFRIFSMTKGIGSLAVMIVIDHGKLSLDTPVEEVLPAWENMQVLDGWDSDTPRLRAPKTMAPPVTADFDPFPGTRVVHSVGFMRNEEDIPGKRSAGAQSWAGVLNSHYWIDPAKDVAAVIMTQSLPFVEERFMNNYNAYERAVYAGL